MIRNKSLNSQVQLRKVQQESELMQQEQKPNNNYFGNNVEQLSRWEGFRESIKDSLSFLILLIVMVTILLIILFVG